MLKNPRWTPGASLVMSPNATKRVWVGNRLAQGGHLRQSPWTSLTEGEQSLNVLAGSDE